MTGDDDIYHYLSLQVLQHLNNSYAGVRQVALLAALLGTVVVKSRLSFHESLTPREKTCLFYTALGKNSQETAQAMNINVTTVKSYRRMIIKKLDAENMAHAIYLGIRYAVGDSY